MSDHFTPLSLRHLAILLLKQRDEKHYFGIPEELFFTGKSELLIPRFGKVLDTPVGVAAGPHTQLSQNIVGAWLCGARYIELKTIQQLDDLTVSKPCISMQEEGYNCEWSQELSLSQSYEQYLDAWILIHLLHRHYQGPDSPFGTCFNMSVGYDLQGIQGDKVSRFLDKMKDCSIEKTRKIKEIEDLFPAAWLQDIPDCISDNVTLSTMHGCPAGEIGEIAEYLMLTRRLHTVVKLNPTLLGPEHLRQILNQELEYDIQVPDEAFAHDLKMPEALSLIRRLQECADQCGLHFGVKLTNTLESLNPKTALPESEKMVYMSGKALHPVSVNLALQIRKVFPESPDISFSAGADCFNIASLVSCGLAPVTVCSDLLKPGGYGRLHQYLEELSLHKATLPVDSSQALSALGNYAAGVRKDPRYKKSRKPALVKTATPLGYFDCNQAPCTCGCPSTQDIPSYLRHTAAGDLESAFAVIVNTNPFPAVTGMVCDHPCQSKCIRSHYDEAIQIRDVKQYVTAGIRQQIPGMQGSDNGIRVAIIGAGPSGLSCAWFLRLAGCTVSVYDEKEEAGGMVASVIPSFRLPGTDLDLDIQRIRATGAEIHLNTPVDAGLFAELQTRNDFVYIASGAKASRSLNLPGSDLDAVLDPLVFLKDAKQGKYAFRKGSVMIIGGGNTAMDAARMARRMVANQGEVSILYRRGIQDMPAAVEEIEEAIREGIRILEWVSPVALEESEGRLSHMVCCRNSPGEADKDGRPVPKPIPGSIFRMEVDVVIPALGQEIVADFLDPETLQELRTTGISRSGKILMGGDALRGASSVIKAIADGRKAAMTILNRPFPADSDPFLPDPEWKRQLQIKKARRRRVFQRDHASELPLSGSAAREEASACLSCDLLCQNCVSVCPNFANYAYAVTPVHIRLKKAVRTNNAFDLLDDRIFSITQTDQILHLDDFCNACGNCQTFCPTRSAPYLEKPKLFFSSLSFEMADKGFHLQEKSGMAELLYKEDAVISRLTDRGEDWRFETPDFVASLDKQDLHPRHIDWKTEIATEADFYHAAVMVTILETAQYLSLSSLKE